MPRIRRYIGRESFAKSKRTKSAKLGCIVFGILFKKRHVVSAGELPGSVAPFVGKFTFTGYGFRILKIRDNIVALQGLPRRSIVVAPHSPGNRRIEANATSRCYIKNGAISTVTKIMIGTANHATRRKPSSLAASGQPGSMNPKTTPRPSFRCKFQNKPAAK